MSSSARVARDHAHAHIVGVYDRDDELISTVATFLSEALHHGGTAVVIATPAHRAALDAELAGEGLPIDALRRSGQYASFDAQSMLDTFMVRDRPDLRVFDHTVGSIVEAAAVLGTPIRLFGEMVVLLWDTGNIEGALELESMWNEIAEDHAFALFCGYAMTSLEAAGGLSAAKQMFERHSNVLSLPHKAAEAPGVGADAHHSSFERVFVGAPAAIREVRRFVRDVLHARRAEEQLADAEIIASELATNAVTHARSPFRVSLTRSASSLTLSVRDASFEQPEARARHTGDGGGRGLALVSELSTAWGTRAEPDGKTVWAELARRH